MSVFRTLRRYRPRSTVARAPEPEACQCLTCVFWRTIERWCRRKGSVAEGIAICDRASTAQAVTLVLADIVLSEPDPHLRRLLVGNIGDVLVDMIGLPAQPRPRKTVEITSCH